MSDCRYHDTTPIAGYLAAHDDAQRRMNAGEQQIRCPDCGLFVWESYYRRIPGKPIIVNRTIVGYESPTDNPKYKPRQPVPRTTCLTCLLVCEVQAAKGAMK